MAGTRVPTDSNNFSLLCTCASHFVHLDINLRIFKKERKSSESEQQKHISISAEKFTAFQHFACACSTMIENQQKVVFVVRAANVMAFFDAMFRVRATELLYSFRGERKNFRQMKSNNNIKK